MLEMWAHAGGGDIDILPPEHLVPVPIQPLPLPERREMPLPHRRFLSIERAAEYVGVSVATFREEVEAGMWPGPVRRGKKGRAVTWDVRALDLAADLASGITAMGSAIIPPDDAGHVGEAALMKRFKSGAPKVDRHQSGPTKKQGRNRNAD
jgi:predicted DNA-binding transcriptional regulator AlpA